MAKNLRYWPVALCLLIACGGHDPVADGPLLPKADVEIVLDDRGVPHIYAQDDEDLFYAYGYQIASDRLLQLEMFRRFAHGRLSEVLGSDGPGSVGANALTDDRFARIFNWKHWGQQDAALMKEQEPEHYQLTSAWVAGINHRIAEIAAAEVPLPYGFGSDQLDFMPEPWTNDDPYIVQKMAGFGLDQTIQFEVFVTFTKMLAPDALDAIELFKPARPTFALPEVDRPQTSADFQANGQPTKMGLARQPDALKVIGDPTPWTQEPAAAKIDPRTLAKSLQTLARLSHLKPLGSNNWAVAGQHTDNGMPIVAGDPHLGYAFSGVTYALHLSSKQAAGSFDVTGFSFVGAPGIFAGHNDKVAWSPTSAFADVMDMWSVAIVDGMAQIGGDEVPVTEREETIAIRGAQPDVITVRDVPGYGVIMPSSLVGSPIPIAGSGKEVLVGWTGFRARPARYFRELMRAQSIDEFDEAVMRLPEMTYNFVAADASGISYRVGVEVPDRNPLAPGREPFMTMDAADPLSFWPPARLSPEQLPHSRAEQRGWIATANNDPFGFTADGKLDNDPWYYGALFPPGWRATRIESELGRIISEGKVDIASMQNLQMDVHSNLADDMLPVIAEAWQQAQSDVELSELVNDPDLAALVQLLTVDWDRQMARDSAGALAFHAFAHYVTAGVMEDDLSPLLFEVVLNSAPMYLLKVAALALSGQYPNGDGVMQEGRNRIVLEALSSTAALLNERFGTTAPAAYQFADMRVSSLDDGYGRGVELFSLPTPGGESTVNVAQSTFRKDGKVLDQWVSHWGPIERQVMNFDGEGVPQSLSNFPLGNIANPDSPHFNDATSDWVEGNYHKMWFSRAEVDAAAEATVRLPAVR